MKRHCSCWWDNVFGVYIGDCCYQHDVDLDDEKLFHCVRVKAWWTLPLAAVMYLGVKIFYHLYKIKAVKEFCDGKNRNR